MLNTQGGMPITLDIIEQKICEIVECAHDSEVAHAREDNLYRDFVQFIAKDAPHKYAHLAAEILKTRALDFPRWYA